MTKKSTFLSDTSPTLESIIDRGHKMVFEAQGGGTLPRRIQRRRTKGWRSPPSTVYVGRPTKWGNPFRRLGSWKMTPNHPLLVELHALWIEGMFPYDTWNVFCYGYPLEPPTHEEIRHELRGKNISCWCGILGQCHGDTLLEIANK